MLGFRRPSFFVAACCVAAALSACGGSGSSAGSHGPEGADAATQSRPAAVVTKVSDGDTIWLSTIGKTRLIGVDTPEVFGQAECFGRAASAFARRMLPLGSRVTYRVGVDREDRYGRALAYVYLPDGRMFNLLLVQRGFATPLTVPPNVEYAKQFVAAARRARDAGRGLWRAC